MCGAVAVGAADPVSGDAAVVAVVPVGGVASVGGAAAIGDAASCDAPPDDATAGERMLGAADVANALSLPLAMTPVPPAQVVAGSPSTGYAELSVVGDSEVGVWEMTAGAMGDTEVDEVFIVLSGSALIEFEGGRSIRVSAGDVVKLDGGARTVWTVTDTIRKVYVTPR